MKLHLIGENFGDEGYADQLYALERARIPSLELVELGRSGETTMSMIVPVPAVPQGSTKVAARATSATSRTARSSPRR
jgi:hypothetical protein